MPVRVERQIGNGMAGELGLSILGIGMVTSVHAAISPSFFTFNSFAKKEKEKAIARKTLFISLGATTATALGMLLLFGRWIPAIASELAGLGLFIGGLACVESAETAPDQPTMAVPESPAKPLSGILIVPPPRRVV